MKSTENNKSTPGERVREVRKDKKFTQKQLADKIFRESSQTISNIENGRSKLTRENAVKIAELCGCTPEYLLCKSDCKHYAGDAALMISKMQRYALALEMFSEYIALTAGIKNQLTVEESDRFIKDVVWYAENRMRQIVEGREDNG